MKHLFYSLMGICVMTILLVTPSIGIETGPFNNLIPDETYKAARLNSNASPDTGLFHHIDVSCPRALVLCGEALPLEDVAVWERLDREFTIAMWDRAQVYMWLKRAGRYFPLIEEELAKADMPIDLKYVAVAESALLPYIKSSAGAVGYWQFMRRTARKNGLRKDRFIDERRNIDSSTLAAIKYLKYLYNRFDSWTLAMAAYNCGENRLRKEIVQQKVNDFFRLNLPMETERYIFRIAAIKIIMENPAKYGYRLPADTIYRRNQYDRVRIKVNSPLHITKFANALGTDYKNIKEMNPQLLRHHLPTGHYTINVPAGKSDEIQAVISRLTGKTYAKKTKQIDRSSRFHIVKPGDTLSSIAQRTGIPIGTLKQQNNLDSSLITVGQKLVINP